MTVGRNELCPCGSGKKFKRCCGAGRAVDTSSATHLERVERGMALLRAGQLDAAEQCFRQALARAAGDAGLLNLLGMVELHRRRFVEAERLFHRAIARNGHEAQFYNNLAHAFKGQGKERETRRALEKAVALDPGCLEAHHNLGNMLEEIGENEAAEAAYRKALELQPNDLETLRELGTLLLSSRKFQEAEAIFRRLLVFQPHDPDAHVSLGESIDGQGLAAEAGRIFKQALSLTDAHDGVLARYGQFLIQMGRFAEAEAFLMSAIKSRGDYPKFYYRLPLCRKFTADDSELLAKIESLAFTEKEPSDELATTMHALGKAFNDLKNYEKAFHCYERANLWFGDRERNSFDRGVFRQETDRIIRFFDAEFLNNQEGWRSDSDMPIFIVGMPRSGTTLTEQIISSHPLVHGAGELTFWSDALAGLGKDYQAALTEEKLQNLGEDYLRELEKYAEGSPHVTDKMPGNCLSLGLIHRAFPKAKIVHCRRNPVDTCLSIYFQNFGNRHQYRCDLGNLAFVYRQYRRLMQHWRSVLPPGTLLEIDYEEMVENQEPMSRKLIEFCGLEWDDRCLEFYKSERQVKTASQWQVRQPMYKSSKERWRNYEPYIGPLLELLQEEE